MLEEFFVEYIQMYLPTWLVRLLVRMYMRIQGPRMRSGDVVIRQIETDTRLRATLPVTTDAETVNVQLYGNDPYFFANHLGPLLKYSACEYPPGVESLAEAETYTIALYQELAGIASLRAGSRVLELGCGWGSLSLANAERWPNLAFTSFSNSPQQIDYIRKQALERGLTNLTLYVEDYAVFVHPDRSCVAPDGSPLFDAAVAIETIEHTKNVTELLSAVAARLKLGATLFVQSLLHQSASYIMDANSWMGRNFFTGGSILSLNSYFHLSPPELTLTKVVPVRGTGYARTLLDWLRLLEPQREEIVRRSSSSFYEGFRMFYISCAEAFGANGGAEFMVGYYVFVRRSVQ